jgi:glycolate oxidase FAD binding subunit
VIGGGTKLAWGAPGVPAAIHVHSGALDRTIAHDPGDMTAIFEAGVPLVRAQAELAEHGQMLALDPPTDGGQAASRGSDPSTLAGSGATLGGVFATADSGPLRHRYGQPRDLVLGITVALSDGTVAKAGSRVIKNVAGYDIAKLFTGSFGTLGMILSVTVRLHPLPSATATAVGSTPEPSTLASAALALARAPLELESLDIAWRSGQGELLARAGGAQAPRRAAEIAKLMGHQLLQDVAVLEDDEQRWQRQRTAQRSAQHAIVRVAGRASQLAALLSLTDDLGGGLVGRAALGSCYIEVDPDRIDLLRGRLPSGVPAVVLDLPAAHRTAIDPWGAAEGTAIRLMRQVKQRFDPAAVCNPGVFVGGI